MDPGRTGKVRSFIRAKGPTRPMTHEIDSFIHQAVNDTGRLERFGRHTPKVISKNYV